MTNLSQRLLTALSQDRAAIRRDPNLVIPLLEQLLTPHFDSEYTARLVLGTQWKVASSEQRRRFAVALLRSLLTTYAGAVAEWTPDRLRILPLHGDPLAPQAVVRTVVTRPGTSDVPVDYRMHQTPDGWKVFDVVVEGVSYVRAYHDDITTDVAQKGLDQTILRLETKASQPVRQSPSHAPGSNAV